MKFIFIILSNKKQFIFTTIVVVFINKYGYAVIWKKKMLMQRIVWNHKRVYDIYVKYFIKSIIGIHKWGVIKSWNVKLRK